MNSAIKAGDLVCITRPSVCCGSKQSIGEIHLVKEIVKELSRCPVCNDKSYWKLAILDDGFGCELIRLIKIDPPALQDETENEKELAQ